MDHLIQILSEIFKFHKELIVPIGLIIVALLSGGFSLVNVLLSKEHKISEFRREWIEDMVKDLSTFLSHTETLTRKAQYELKSKNQTVFSNADLEKFRNDNNEIYLSLYESFHRFQSRLNPKEMKHINVENDILKIEEIFTGNCSSTKCDDTISKIRSVKDPSRDLFKREWKRVKGGEITYRIMKYFLIVFTIFLSFVVFVFFYSIYQVNKSTSNESTKPNIYMKVNADVLNVRESPSIKSQKLSELKYGDIVEVLEDKYKWSLVEYKIREANNITRQGWVYNIYLENATK